MEFIWSELVKEEVVLDSGFLGNARSMKKESSVAKIWKIPSLYTEFRAKICDPLIPAKIPSENLQFPLL